MFSNIRQVIKNSAKAGFINIINPHLKVGAIEKRHSLEIILIKKFRKLEINKIGKFSM